MTTHGRGRAPDRPDAALAVLHRIRPVVAAPDPRVRARARTMLDAALLASASTGGARASAGVTVLAPRASRHRLLRRGTLAVATVAAALVAFVAMNTVPGAGHAFLSDPACAAEALQSAAQAAALQPATGAVGSERHLRWESLPGLVLHDTFQGPGNGEWQTVDYTLGQDRIVQDAPMFDIPASSLRGLSDNPVRLRQQMTVLATQQGFDALDPVAGDHGPAIWMAVIWALPDPYLAPRVRSAMYRVLADLDSASVVVRNLGAGQDPIGRWVITLELHLTSDNSQQLLYIDAATGQLDGIAYRQGNGAFTSGQLFLESDLVRAAPTAPTLP
jgi:hypothetical protein